MGRLLFITSGPIGDAVLSTGALEHARRRLGGSPRVVVACGPAPAPLFAGVPNLERVIVLKKQPLALHWAGLWARLVGKRFDLAVDLRASAVTALLSVRERWRVRPTPLPGEHKCAAIARALGLHEPLSPRLHVTPAAVAAALAAAPAGERFWAVGPGAKFPGKRWPLERFEALALRLMGEGGPLEGARMLALGSGEEAGLCESLAERLRAQGLQATSLAGKLDLLAAAALLARAQLFVGNDSGLMHGAAAARAPTLGLFGPSDERVYAPFGVNAVALRGPTPYDALRAAGWSEADPRSLLEDLTVDRVEVSARRLLMGGRDGRNL